MPEPGNLWRPSTEAELLRAAADAQLDEATVCLEFKERFEPGKAANRKLAEEIASLAVDGGSIVIGVVDPKNRRSASASDAVAPVPLSGMVERIESLARQIPDPPIAIRCWSFPSDRAPGAGYVVIDVPQSAEAPHFVDGRPYGRNGTQKAVLSSAQVVGVLEARRARAKQADAELEACRARWARGSEPHTNGFVYLTAVPLGTREDQAYLSHPKEDPSSWARALVNSAEEGLVWQSGGSAIFDNPHVSRSIDGYLLSTHPLTDGSPIDRSSWSGIDLLELTDNGHVRFLSGSASYWMSKAQGVQKDHELLLVEMIATLRMVMRAVGLYGEKMNYLGSWSVSLLVEGIAAAGIPVWSPINPNYVVQFPAREHRGATSASTAELAEDPGRVVSRMVGPLLRVMQQVDSERIAALLSCGEAAAP